MILKDEELVKEILLACDFSKNNPGFKERLRLKLKARMQRKLSDDELDYISAAGDNDVRPEFENKK